MASAQTHLPLIRLLSGFSSHMSCHLLREASLTFQTKLCPLFYSSQHQVPWQYFLYFSSPKAAGGKFSWLNVGVTEFIISLFLKLVLSCQIILGYVFIYFHCEKILLPFLLPPNDPSVKSDLNSETFLSPTCFHTCIEYLVCYFKILSCFALLLHGWGYMACIFLGISFLSFTCEHVTRS